MNTSIEEYNKTKAFAENLYKNSNNLTFLINSTEQDTELRRLKEGLRFEQFFLIVDMIDFEIKHIVGIENLGYQSEKITMKDYFQMIKNDGVIRLMGVLARESFNLAEMRAVGFLRPKFVANLPITHADGRTMLVKRVISPWQISNEGKITAYLSEFTIVCEYNGEPMSPRIEDVPTDVKEKFDQVVDKSLAVQPHFKNPFSPKEMILLKYYANNENLPAKVVAQDNQIEVSTMHYYNKLILTKAKGFFGEKLNFKTAKDVAAFLKKNGFMNE